MGAFCLTKEFTDKFLQGLKSGEIDPEKMAEMSSEDRHTYLAKFVGEENAKNVNSLFESKLLLKDKQQGYINWAKRVGSITVEARRDIISRVQRMDKILDPKEEEKFLHDLASTRLGLDVTQEEAKTIADLSKKIDEAAVNRKPDQTFPSEAERLNYGAAKVAFYNYVNDLKASAGRAAIIDYVKNPTKAISGIAGIAKSVKASLDDSAIFRQGWKTLWTNPMIWQKNARLSFVDLVKSLGGQNVMDGIKADIVSRPTYDKMVKAKLAIGTIEESYPTTLPEKIPLFGKFYKASETAFTGFVYRQRADIFDKYLQIAEKSGININDVKELQPIASMVNSLTGRGNFGKYEGSGVDLANNVFFSPRYLKSQVDTLGHAITGAGGSNFVRKQAAINLLKVVAGTAAVLVIAKAINPNSVEQDPRSSDFGKIKIGDTRFDVSGGMGSVITLAMRLAAQSSKSSSSGKITNLDTGKFGAPTTKDVIFNFATNKFSPATAFLLELRAGKDSIGNKSTPLNAVKNLLEPLPLSNIEDSLKNPNSANLLLTVIADGLGIATNTYAPRKISNKVR